MRSVLHTHGDSRPGLRPSVTPVACRSICTILSPVWVRGSRYACRCIEKMWIHRYGNRRPSRERLKAQGDRDIPPSGIERDAITRRLDDMGKLDGKIALVTGGSSGIGLAAAKQFVGEGAYVFITGRREPELASAVKEIGNNVTGVGGDVSNHADLDRLFGQIQREKGRLDVLFANAGA